MSTTFTAEISETIGYVITCCYGAEKFAPQYTTEAEAHAALNLIPGGNESRRENIRAILPGCEMPDTCPEYPLEIRAIRGDEGTDLQVHMNQNAAGVLDALGIENHGQGGRLEAQQMLGRVLVARGLAPEDEGMPVDRQGRFVGAGRPAGYLQDRLMDLQDLVEWCVQQGRAVVWG